MTEAGFLHAYVPQHLRALLESALIWFDGEEREVHTLEPNGHERSQHWQSGSHKPHQHSVAHGPTKD